MKSIQTQVFSAAIVGSWPPKVGCWVGWWEDENLRGVGDSLERDQETLQPIPLVLCPDPLLDDQVGHHGQVSRDPTDQVLQTPGGILRSVFDHPPDDLPVYEGVPLFVASLEKANHRLAVTLPPIGASVRLGDLLQQLDRPLIEGLLTIDLHAVPRREAGSGVMESERPRHHGDGYVLPDLNQALGAVLEHAEALGEDIDASLELTDPSGFLVAARSNDAEEDPEESLLTRKDVEPFRGKPRSELLHRIYLTLDHEDPGEGRTGIPFQNFHDTSHVPSQARSRTISQVQRITPPLLFSEPKKNGEFWTLPLFSYLVNEI